MANVRKLMRLARDYEASEGRDLAGFLALAADSTERDEREGMAAVQAEGHDGVRVMTVHAAKGLQFPVVAVPDLGRGLCTPATATAISSSARRPSRREGAHRFGMRLVFAAEKSFGVWELVDINDGGERRRGRGGLPARLRRRLARRGPPDPQRLLQGRRARAAGGAQARATRRCAACCRRSASAAGTGGHGLGDAPRRASDRSRASGSPTSRSRSGSPSRAQSAPPSCVRRFDPPPEPATIPGTVAPPPLLERAPIPGADRPPLLLGACALRALRLSLLRRARARCARGPGGDAGRSRARTHGDERDDRRAARARCARAISRSGSATQSTPRSNGAPSTRGPSPGRRAARAPARPRGAR